MTEETARPPAPRLEVSDLLRRSVGDLGAAAQRWLDRVPARLAEVAEQWDVELGPQVHHAGANSIVVGATTRDGSPAVVKLTVPHEDARGEAVALRRWRGDGAVRLLRSSPDGFTLLLERCWPGHDLWPLPVDDQIAVIVELLPRLWQPPEGSPAVRELADTVADWRRRMRDRPETFDVPADVAARAGEWAEDLGGGHARRLLHGDLNPGNVLAAGDAWVVIDPKPWIGDPAFDLAQLLVNWVRVEPTPGETTVEITLRRAEQLADRLALDVRRVLRWALVKAVGWHADREHALTLEAAALRDGD